MSKSADAYNNPFLIDGRTSPPMRSAFAVLDAEAADLAHSTVDSLLERAISMMRRDPDSATTYGQANSRDDLVLAAERLRDPDSRLVNEILDFSHVPFSVADAGELRDIVAAYRSRLTQGERPPIVNVAALAHLLQALPVDAGAAKPQALTCARPELPSASEILKGLA
jgi:hypothetical protein